MISRRIEGGFGSTAAVKVSAVMSGLPWRDCRVRSAAFIRLSAHSDQLHRGVSQHSRFRAIAAQLRPFEGNEAKINRAARRQLSRTAAVYAATNDGFSPALSIATALRIGSAWG
jgi:hypothetical protein